MEKSCVVLLTSLLACDSATSPGSTQDPASRLVNVVVFDSDRSGHYAVYKMNFDGTAPQLITPAAETASCPSVSPDGSSVVYYRAGQDSTAAILMRADGTDRVELVRALSFEGCPVWSPNGAIIILQPVSNPSKPVTAVNTFSTGGARLAAFFAGSSVVASSRGSDALVYDVVSLTGNDRVVISGLDGSNARTVSTYAKSPAVSLVADQIAARCWPSGVTTSSALCSMKSDGTLIWAVSTSVVGAPSFSPNGKLIAFNCAGTICVTAADGKGMVSGGVAAVDPVAWAPASDKIFFPCFPNSSFANNYSEDICRINSDGSGLMNLTSGYHNQHASVASAAP